MGNKLSIEQKIKYEKIGYIKNIPLYNKFEIQAIYSYL